MDYNITISKIPLEGDETIGALSFFSLPVDLFLVSLISRLYATRKANEDWTSDLREAHAILVATRLQGSVFSTHSLDRLIWDGHIVARGTSSREHTYWLDCLWELGHRHFCYRLGQYW